MSTTFQLQLLTSFIVGGSAVTILTLIAERANPQVAGIILSLPSNMAVSLFFIGWVLSPSAVAVAAPAIPISLGISMFFTAIYVVLAQKIHGKKSLVIISCISISLAIWFLLALPVALFKLTYLVPSLLGYIVLTVLAHVLLRLGPEPSGENVRVQYTGTQKLGRALFAGAVIAFIVYLSKTLGPVWGGVFSVFPAANSSTLLILHWQRDADVLKKVSRNMPLGSPIFLVYLLVAVLTFPFLGIILGTIVCYLVSFIALLIYLKLLSAHN